MSTTRQRLKEISANLDESMGVRQIDLRPKLSPVASAKDVGRRPLRSFGRIEVDLVVPDPSQPRSDFSNDAIERLATSIREKGQLHPIRVRWSASSQKWLIISGERRWRATKAAGLPTIDCFFQESTLTEAEVLEQQLVENLLREDLSPMEEARGFKSLMDLNTWNGRQVAEALRIHPSKVSRALALLKLPDDIQGDVESKKLAPRSAYELSKLSDNEAKVKLAKEAISGELTRDQTAKLVRQRRGRQVEKKTGTRQVFFADNDWQVIVSCKSRGTYHDMEEALQQALEEVRHYIAQGRKVLG